MNKAEWEEVWSNGKPNVYATAITTRMRIPGGYIYKHERFPAGFSPLVQMIYVPEPQEEKERG
jgi:hypothetical protein